MVTNVYERQIAKIEIVLVSCTFERETVRVADRTSALVMQQTFRRGRHDTVFASINVINAVATARSRRCRICPFVRIQRAVAIVVVVKRDDHTAQVGVAGVIGTRCVIVQEGPVTHVERTRTTTFWLNSEGVRPKL